MIRHMARKIAEESRRGMFVADFIHGLNAFSLIACGHLMN